jgi:hypothetical protein
MSSSNDAVGILLFPPVVLILFCFVRTYCNWPRDWDKEKDGDFTVAFLEQVEKEARWNGAQKDVMKQLLRLWGDGCGGVILAKLAPALDDSHKLHANHRYQMIEFCGPTKLRQLPVVEIQWAYSSRISDAEQFLCGEKMEVLDLEAEVFVQVFEHLESYCRTEELLDTMARCRVYEGYLVPRRL